MTRTRSALVAVVVLVVAALVAPGAWAQPDRGPRRPDYQPGAPGAGDPYFPLAGNGGYDVQHYDLDIRYDPATRAFDGVATIDLVTTQDLDHFNLDLRDLTVERVHIDGKRTRFTHEGQELVLRPRPKLRAGTAHEVVVTYGGTTGNPTDVEGAPYGWWSTDDGAMVVNEPDGAPTWFPVNDHPTDKATYSFSITVPQGTVAVANGLLTGTSTRRGWTTYEWEEPDQMASYLATATVGDFELRQWTTADGLPIIDAVDRDLPASATAPLADTERMIAFFEDLYGPYPFVSYGAIADDDSVGYALETQTRPVYSRNFGEGTVAHELAHQWLGNAVSPGRWADIWLNEGWATYSTWLWNDFDGNRPLQQSFDMAYTNRPSSFWRTIVADPGFDNLFASAVYDRGAMTLHQLRQRIGDADFFELARTWIATYDDGTATTADFIALAEQISGQDLDAFFTAWLYTPEQPSLTGP
ncbi:MAG TPA: M1 family metallopeptidase [Actinopolymorphaceae bacterium]